jgi:hypothetical protein
MADPIAAGPVPVDRLLTVDRPAAGLQVVVDPVVAGRQAEVGLAVEVLTVVAADRQMEAASLASRLSFIG